MLRTTLEVVCDNCQSIIVIPSESSAARRTDTRPEWELCSFSHTYKGNVIIPDVERYLDVAGWRVDLEDEPVIECPTCKEVG